MATQLRATQQVKNNSLTKNKLALDFLEGTDLDLTNGSKNATLKGLKDAVLPDSPITKSQFDSFTSLVAGSLMLAGSLDASSLGSQLDNALKGSYYIVTVAGTIFGTNPIELAIGDHLIAAVNITGTPTNGANFIKIDNTEATDILRQSSIINGLTSTDATKVLSAAQGKVLKDALDAYIAGQPVKVYGEAPTITNGSATLGALANSPISGSERVYLNGLRMERGASADYTIDYTTKVITFLYVLVTGDKVLVDYEK